MLLRSVPEVARVWASWVVVSVHEVGEEVPHRRTARRRVQHERVATMRNLWLELGGLITRSRLTSNIPFTLSLISSLVSVPFFANEQLPGPASAHAVVKPAKASSASTTSLG